MLTIMIYANNRFYKQLNNIVAFKELWENSISGADMLMIALYLEVDKKKLAIARGECAKIVIHLMTDKRSVDAVNAVIEYGNGIITEDQLKTYIQPAIDAGYGIGLGATGYNKTQSLAARAAAFAVNICFDNVGGSAYQAADASAENDKETPEKTRAMINLQTADICRNYLTNEVIDRVRLFNKFFTWPVE